jgi:hypothetical protein
VTKTNVYTFNWVFLRTSLLLAINNTEILRILRIKTASAYCQEHTPPPTHAIGQRFLRMKYRKCGCPNAVERVALSLHPDVLYVDTKNFEYIIFARHKPGNFIFIHERTTTRRRIFISSRRIQWEDGGRKFGLQTRYKNRFNFESPEPWTLTNEERYITLNSTLPCCFPDISYRVVKKNESHT